jgi:hypothetical protein
MQDQAANKRRDIVRDLENWREDYAKEKGFELYYTFSPEWEQLSSSIWLRYDGIDAQRREHGIPRLLLQDSVDAFRHSLLETRNISYKIMNDKLWVLSPLWIQLNRYHGRPSFDRERRANSWKFMISDLEEFSRLFEHSRFKKLLSRSQTRSFEIINAWWKAAYCDPDLLTAVRHFIQDRAGTVDTTNPTLWAALGDAAIPTKTILSLYHSSCFLLMLLEFHSQTWEPYVCGITLLKLKQARYRAACLAATQKLAYFYWKPDCRQDRPFATYPQAFLNEIHSSENLSKAPTPYYLWDTNAEKTVEVSTLPRLPEYICISHTWGRWRIGADAAIRNVPWKVPENTRFDVKELPRQLKVLGYDYVWFDLLCIPQDESNRERANIEIANQAAIFKRSSHCIAWINDMESWSDVNNALRWLSLKWLKITSRLQTDVIDKKISNAADASVVTSESFSIMKGTSSFGEAMQLNRAGEPATWFSSLWTLQECVLCPDLELRAKDWQRLEDAWGNPIPLRALMVFIRETWNHCWLEERIDTPFHDPNAYNTAIMRHPLRETHYPKWQPPNGISRLLDLCAMTQLDNVLTTGSPTTVLTNANIRQSTSNRAPAIMSAVGVTDWFKDGISNQSKPRHLVFGIYPIEFLREAARKFGAIFYESSSSKPASIPRFRDILLRKPSSGSMLPFTREAGWFCGVTGSAEHCYLDVIDHAAVQTWNICPDGSIDLPTVGVAFRSDESEKIHGSLYFVEFEENRPERRGRIFSENTIDISERLRKSHGTGLIIGVALYGDCQNQHGCLLKRVRWHSL